MVGSDHVLGLDEADSGELVSAADIDSVLADLFVQVLDSDAAAVHLSGRDQLGSLTFVGEVVEGDWYF